VRPEERTPEQIAEQLAELRRFRFCPTCCMSPCGCPRYDLDEDLLMDERFWDLGPDDEPIEWDGEPW
jgi:hypothetical protein